MVRAPLLQISDIALTFGGTPLFEGVSLTVHEGDRIALVGRNGSGKSTLLRIMAGLVEPDRGQRATGPGTTLGYMEQDPDLSGFDTLGAFAAAGLPPGEDWRVAQAAEGLGFDPTRPVATASGGEKRRAALARLLAAEPELLLLDEPTNHLDIAAIQWLEERLRSHRGAFVLISHDRAVLRNVTAATLWLDRGILRRQDRGFDQFEDWRDSLWAEEDAQRHKLDRLIRAESRWAVEGISARRKRNMGRLRALEALRAERREQIRRPGAAALMLESGPLSGKRVIVAQGLTKRFGTRTIVRDFDLIVQRGDRVALVGPNGAGKTTLVNLLLGRIQPDAGTVTHGTHLEVALLDQTRAALDPEATLWESLTGDPALRAGRSDQVMVRGEPRHVVGYLKDFLFDEAQARAPVKALSGGEKARLLLARIMARQANLLVLDEPTNDLDIETLDLLQDVLDGYDGTVLLVSHDRDFLDRVATVTVALEGDGTAVAYAGGWSDMMAQRGGRPLGGSGMVPGRSASHRSAPSPAAGSAPSGPAPQRTSARKGLTFTERHRLETLPAEIDRLTAEIARLDALLSDPDLFTREPVKFRKATELLAQRQAALTAAEDEWLALAEKAEG
ncbi:ATPase component of ABC transporter with duplicated ATPase domain protein [Rubellimicrobium thermophilum DSM 16684]|uniref:ATPase component of ABC transporter with duplicated ATPase domain protein n=1 Tax=Rubellimicrobium thermophilum DSM 16684 TaxID=1123069 RepID=S9R1M1_9RHOB|nr:ATP-binding cassette domain-containing protein [Rubellimicrobium thermophilum]EPX85792.1 ATPase component of ABC transporter with duplicated ATPase domain protein [Rubellimicrobium thermophilum DSM 16684]